MTAGGKQGGRSKADVSARRRATIWQMHNRGNGVREIARRLGLHPSTVAYYLKDKKTPTRRSIVGPPKEQTDSRPTPQEHSAQVLSLDARRRRQA
jgi:IS30 family transposase